MSRRWRTPRWYSWLLLAAGLALFLSAGRWQLHRAQEKTELLATYARNVNAPPRPFVALAAAALDPGDTPRVNVSGHYLADRSYLLDEQPYRGRIGVHAIGVFAPDGDTRRLLVDRGWIEWNHAPGSTPNLPPLPEGQVSLTGLYAPLPRGGIALGGDALPAQSTWPKLTLRLDAQAIARDLGTPVYPRGLELDADPASGFVREWSLSTMPPERHLGYAFQWFALAATALVVFLGLHWTRTTLKS